ncbi:hypothetical protein FA15DRAFT_609910 [Coprinopsis marcescibilis]|uniref:Uncharacterized protein n=1 Tax=Coprinopsis marcescibilis TaxID=230819 RepID=A0A5C3LM26_COPMA|nr:hypothetical protein FA15DRAFT_609910 [Coprinopsis marcescibilis]
MYSPSFPPSSSPASSPATAPIDSSPGSSPITFEPLNLDDDGVPPITHPFAASFTQKQKRDKYLSALDDEDNRAVKKARHTNLNCRGSSCTSEEDETWARVAEEAYEKRTRNFNLTDHRLTRIDPMFIVELRNMVVFPDNTERSNPAKEPQSRLFQRVTTEPANAARQFRRSFSRTESISSASVPGEQPHNISFYLANNFIAKLPKVLFSLSNLVTLSLRNNRIKFLPPDIGLLAQLRHLNISMNQLTYLPAELDQLALNNLQVHPNPFKPKPDDCWVTDATLLFSIPSMVEIASRILLSPPPPSLADIDGEDTAPLETLLDYYLPLPPRICRQISPPLINTLNACLPGSIITERPKELGQDESGYLTGIGKCPNPLHSTPQSFVWHAEERLSWEKRVAGQLLGGDVPLRWRGCGRGCLAFLDEKNARKERCEENAVPKAPEMVFAPVVLTGAALDFDDE